MKMGRTLGVVATGGILFGLWISGWLKGFGLGDGTIPGVQVSTQQTSVSNEDVDETLSKPDRTPGTPASMSQAEPGNQVSTLAKPAPAVLDVIIDEEGYHFRDEKTYSMLATSIPLEEIVQQALKTQGTSDGPRVKIYRKASSRPSAEARLATALSEAGLKPVDIYWHPAVTE